MARLQQLLRQRCSASDSILRSRKEEWFRLQRPSRRRSSASESNLRSRKEEWFRLQRLSRQRSSASDSILRSCKEEWPACNGRRGNDLSHLILIFVAAKKNGSPAVHPQRQPKSRLRLVSCCSDSGFHGVNSGIAAGFCLFTLCCVHRFLISGPDLRVDARISPELAQWLHRFLISGPDLRIDARFSPFKSSFVHRFLISGSNLRIDAGFSRFTPSFVQ